MAEKLIEGIIAEADRESEKLIQEAERRAEDIRSGARKRAARQIEEAEEQGEAKAAIRLEREKLSVAADVRKLHFRVRDEIRRELMKELNRKVRELPESSDYHRLLMGWVVEAAQGVGEESAYIYIGREDKRFLLPELIEEASHLSGVNLSIAPEERAKDALASFDCSQGVILTDRQGRIAFDNSMNGRLKRKEKDLQRLIERELM